jgi:lipoprotein NlpI
MHPIFYRSAAAAALVLTLAGATPNTDQDPFNIAFQQCRARQGDSGALIKSCSFALSSHRLVPAATAMALAIRGGALLDVGERKASLGDLDAAIKISPDYVFARFVRAGILSGERQHERELQDWNEIIRLKPDAADAFRRRADTLDSIGRSEEAITDYTEAIRLAPSNAGAYVDRGIAYGNAGDDTHALEDFATAIDRDPNDGHAFVERGILHFARGDFGAAATDFAAGLRARPTDHYAALGLYVARQRAGQDGSSELADAAGKLDLETWPGPVILLYLQKIGPQQLNPASDPVPLVDFGNLCEANFYRGEYYLIHQAPERAADAFQAAIDTGATEYVEYRLARAELKALKR